MDPIDLFEKTISGTLSESECERLEELVLNDEAVRREYLEYLDLHGSLYWEASAAGREPFNVVPMPKPRPVFSAALKVAACLALLAGGMWLGAGALKPDRAPVIATLESAKNCRWSSSELPTNAGAELTAGLLDLTSGLATIRFASGATVQLEGPARIDLIDAMNCRLISGTLVADVPPPAQGFTIDTKTAELIDYGTEFGVTVDGVTGKTNIQVFTGIVDVAKKAADGEVHRLTTGQQSTIGSDSFQIAEEQPVEMSRFASALPARRSGEVHITTADGRGADRYVQGHSVLDHVSANQLLVKNPLRGDRDHARKVYLRFDLAEAPEQVSEAALDLWIRQSGFGYASFVADAEFEVYALTGDTDWDPEALTWETAPANDRESGFRLVQPEATSLGTFTIPQGKDRGKVTFSSDELANVLSNSGETITLVIVRNTRETRSGGIVHAFASSRAPNAAPPMLRLK